MEKGKIKYKGKKYPTLTFDGSLIGEDGLGKITIADYELSKAIEQDCENGDIDALNIDSEIYYFCDSGFVASHPSEEKVIKYFSKL